MIDIEISNTDLLGDDIQNWIVLMKTKKSKRHQGHYFWQNVEKN